MELPEIAIVIAALAAGAAIVSALLARKAVNVQREQIKMSGFIQIQEFIERRRDDRGDVLAERDSYVNSKEGDEACLVKKFVTEAYEYWPELEAKMHHIACDFSDLGALLSHDLAPEKLCLDLWCDTIVTHWKKWLAVYRDVQKKKYGRESYWGFVVKLVEKAEAHKDSLKSRPG